MRLRCLPMQKPALKFALIILDYNSVKETLDCLHSLKKQTYPHFEVIVVDNGSSIHKIKEKFPEHIYIENGENLGFTGGCNRGLKEGIVRGADLLMLLNNDTTHAPKMLEEIALAAQNHPEAGAFGPKIFFEKDPATIWYAGGTIDPKTKRCIHIGYGEPSGYTEETTTDYICGCALAVRRAVVEKVGFLDERFFLIWEEIDWCKRIRDQGYSCLFVPKAKLWHKISSSFAEGNRGPMWQYFYHRNRLLYHKKHTSFHQRWSSFHTKELFSLLKDSFHPKSPKSLKNRSRAALLGTLDHFLGNYGKKRLKRFMKY